MDGLMHDVLTSLRGLLKHRGFAVAALLTMAFGIGVNTTIFSVFHGVLLAPLPYPAPDRLTLIWKDFSANFPRGPMSPRDLVELRRLASLYESIGGIWPVTGTLVADGRPEGLRIGRVTSNFLAVLGVPPMRGRTFTPADEAAGPASAIISAGLWQSRFGGRDDVLGRALQIDGGWGVGSAQYTIVGVMPRDFEMLLPFDASVPASVDVWVPFQDDWASSSGSYLRTIGRLAPGASLAAAQEQIEQAGRPMGGPRRFYALPLHDDLVKDTRFALIFLQIAVGFVLLIACISVASLLVVRGQQRQKELAIRVALGARRWRLARLLLVESLLLAIAGGLTGLLLTALCLRLLPLLDAATLPRGNAVTLSRPVLAVSMLASLGSGLLFGLAPLIGVWRDNLESVLRMGGVGRGTEAQQRTRRLLVLAEIGLSVVLLISAGLLIRTFMNLHSFIPGYRSDHVLTFQLALSPERYGGEGTPRFAQALEAALRAVPGVEAVGAVNQLPLDDAPNYATSFRTRETAEDPELPPLADARLVTPGYFETLRAELVAGRWLTERDDATQAPVVLVDERLARRAWPGQSAVGQELKLQAREGWSRVVGVVRHLRQHRLSEEVREEVFLPLAQFPRHQLAVVVRASVEPVSLLAAITAAIRRIDPNLSPSRVRPLGDLEARSRAAARFSMLLAAAFAGFSLMLACLSLYGVIAYAVALRTPELAVRAALGASRGDLIRLVAGQGLRLIAAGLALGLAGAVAVVRGLETLLFGVTPFDPITFGSVVLVVLLTAVLACYVPARRAARVDPIVALRSE